MKDFLAISVAAILGANLQQPAKVDVAIENGDDQPLPIAAVRLEMRQRKLLLHSHEIRKLIGRTAEKGLTLVPLELYWKNGRAKLSVGLAKGKKQHDKRAVEKDRDWTRDKARLLRRG